MVTIRVDGVWKRFLLRRDRADSVGQLMVQMLPWHTRPKPTPFWALQDISFTLEQGESIGIIGDNGSGKSTLLKILTRTMVPSLGRVSVRGKLSSLIELGAGFHPDFSGRENIVLNASILGIDRRTIMKRMDEIVEFAGIGAFIDTPVKYYSSGMQARLGFSIAIHVDPTILVVDEVLGVGDEAFQRKCNQRIAEMHASGISFVLVSHDMASVERLTDKAIWLTHGTVGAQGTPRHVVTAYRSASGVSDKVPLPDSDVRLAGS
ncbi:MAG: ABC transporter ATP-binding protein [Acidobacteriaceae bacterium]